MKQFKLVVYLGLVMSLIIMTVATVRADTGSSALTAAKTAGAPFPLASAALPQAEPTMQAGVYRVDVGGTDTPDCGSEALPCRTIQYAVDLAQSGDVVAVAAGTYTRSAPPPTADCNIGSALAEPVVCVINRHLTILGGYNPDDWSDRNPQAYPTIIDGQNDNRGVVVVGWDAESAMASLVMEGLVIRQGLALGAGSGDDWIVGAYGGGLYATNAPVTLRHMTFEANRALGGSTNQTYGGVGAGGAVALNSVPADTVCILEDITFSQNQALGGEGLDRGGTAIGGGLYVDTADVQGSGLDFVDNVARAGNSTGAGRDNVYNLTADGLGGGAAAHVNSHVSLERVSAIGNEAFGGDAADLGGAGHGGAFYAEEAVLELEEADLRENRAVGGNGLNGYVGGGGGLMATESSVSLDRSVVIGNEAWGGNGTTGHTGAAGGGGLYLLRTSSQPDTIQISNSIIAGNLVVEGEGSILSGGGGGGFWLQGVDVKITHTTIARNRLSETLGFGVAGIVVNFACERPAVVDMDYSIIEGHTHAWGDALHVWEGNTLHLYRSLFAANSKDTNADGSPGWAPGTFTGLSTCLEVDSAGFVAPGSPDHDYHLAGTSPALDQAIDSTEPLDIDGEARPQDQAPDIGADEMALSPLTLAVSQPESGSLALSWLLTPGLLDLLDHYEILVSAETGSSPPNEGALGNPIDIGQQTTFTLSGLTDGEDYVIQIAAYDTDTADSLIAEIIVTTHSMRVFRIFLPLIESTR